MDRAARRQGRLNNTAAASAAGTLGDPSQDRDLPYHPTSNFLAWHAADPVGQRDAQNAAWVAQAEREAGDIYDYSQPTPHMWTADEDAKLLAVLRRGDCFSVRGIDWTRVAEQLEFDVGGRQCIDRWQRNLKDTADGIDALAAGRAASEPTGRMVWTAGKDSAIVALVKSGVGVQPRGDGARVSHKAVAERLDFVVTERQLTDRWCALKKTKEGREALAAGLEVAKAAPAAPRRRRANVLPTASSEVSLRKKWKQEELELSRKVAELFVAGRLENCPDGTLLKELLAELLHCQPGRVKNGQSKFTTVDCTRAYVHRGPPTDAERAALGSLETAFHESLDAKQRWVLEVADAEPTPGAAAAATDAARAAPPSRVIGAWTPEEDARLETLVAAFEAGRASCSPGETLETFLSRELGCSRYRIALKFKGNGKHGTELDGRTFAPNEGDAHDAGAAVAMEEDPPTRPGTPAQLATAPPPVPHGDATDEPPTPPGADEPMAEAPRPGHVRFPRREPGAPLNIGNQLPAPPPREKGAPRTPQTPNTHSAFAKVFKMAPDLKARGMAPFKFPASPYSYIGWLYRTVLGPLLTIVQDEVETVDGGVPQPNDAKVLRVLYARLRRDHAPLLRKVLGAIHGITLDDEQFQGLANQYVLVAVNQETSYTVGALALAPMVVEPLFAAYPETNRSYFSRRLVTVAVAEHSTACATATARRELLALVKHRLGLGDGDTVEEVDGAADMLPFAPADDGVDGGGAMDASEPRRAEIDRFLATAESEGRHHHEVEAEVERMRAELDGRRAEMDRLQAEFDSLDLRFRRRAAISDGHYDAAARARAEAERLRDL